LADLVETSVEGRVGLVRLNRPEARNALSPEMRARLLEELERLDADPETGCIVIAGSDEFFAAGADIRALAERPVDAPADPAGIEFWQRLAALATPTIAAVSGYAFGGGCELALACDMIVADEKAKLGQPEVKLGIIPGGGGTQRLARAIGRQRAMELVLTGRSFDARAAFEWGLVNRCAAEGAWLEEALDLARRVAAGAPIAVRLGKRAVRLAEQTDLDAGLLSERALFDEAMASEDRVEGMKAFLERRDPEFRGR
jgi:enoyl-CoA hydratase/carnithine racemase